MQVAKRKKKFLSLAKKTGQVAKRKKKASLRKRGRLPKKTNLKKTIFS